MTLVQPVARTLVPLMESVRPVKTTSGGGFLFEDYFGAYVAAAMLAGRPLLDVELGPPLRIDFQVASDGWRLDDVLVQFSAPAGRVRWCASVKSYAFFASEAPPGFVKDAWAELLGVTGSGFEKKTDLLGVVTAPLELTVSSDLYELVRLAREQAASDLDRRINTAGYVSAARAKLWKSFSPPEGLALPPDISPSSGEVLGRLRVVEADFERPNSHSEATAVRWCSEALLDHTKGRFLWESLLREVAKVRTAGGFLDEARLIARLAPRHNLRSSSDAVFRAARRLIDRSNARLVEGWLAAGIHEQLAHELAADSSIGTMPQSMPERGIVAIEADFGSGKTVASERLHQADIESFLRDRTEALPIHLRARDVNASLEDAVATAAAGLGDPYEAGVRVVLDGLDEVGFARGTELLYDARVLVRTISRSRVVITARPGFAFREGERRALQPLSDDELFSLSARVTGHRFSLYNVPPPVRDAVRRPLFAIIALRRQARAAELPTSRARMLEALVQDALGGERSKAMVATDALAKTACLTLQRGGHIAAADIGGPDVEANLLATRLVVRGDLGLQFALPIIEQYFGAHALLRGHVKFSEVVKSLDQFEQWRYALVVAVGIGNWAQSSALLTALAELSPGAACWVVKEAVSDHAPRGASASALPGSGECARRLRDALSHWLKWLGHLAPATRLTRDESFEPLPVGALAENGSLVAGLVRTAPEGTDVLEFGSDVHPLSPTVDRSIGPLRAGRPPLDEQAWPWRWTLDWIGSSIEALLTKRGLRLGDDDPLEPERVWSLARRLVGDRSLLHKPIDPQRVFDAAAELLAQLDDPQALVRFHGLATQFTREEIANLATQAREQTAPFQRPWPVPDNLQPRSGWVWDLYTAEAMRELIERVYRAALHGYVGLVEKWFPTWAPTLGWAAALPIHLAAIIHEKSGARLLAIW